MNNIEILEEFIKHYKEVQEKYKDDEIQAEIERSCYFEEVPAEAIENLIQENKELKICNKIKQLLENDMLGYIRGYKDGRNGSTGLAYQVGKQFSDYILTLKLNNYKEDYLKARKLLDESIPKSKIKEKIEELEKEYKILQQTSDFIIADTIQPKIEVLQELLEGE